MTKRRSSGLLERAKRSTFLRSVGILSSGQAVAYLIGLVSIPLLTRVYSPSAFGEFALIASIASVFASVCSLGLQSAVVKVRSDRDAHFLMSVGFFLSTALVAAGWLVAIVSRLDVTGAQGGDNAIPRTIALSLIAVLAILTNINSYMNYYANRRSANRVLFANTLIAASSTLLISVPFGLVGAGTWGLLAGSILSTMISIGQMAVRLHPPFVWPRVSRIRLVLKRNRDFIIFLYPANLLETFTGQLPRQVLAFLFGSAALGQLSLNDRVMSIPLRLLGAPISTIYFREASNRIRAGLDVSDFTYRIVTRVLYASLAPVLVLMLWGEDVFAFALGAEWASAGRIAAILAVPSVFQLARICVSYALVVVGGQRINLLLGLLRLGIEGGALLLGVKLGVGLYVFLSIFAVASTFFYVIDMTITLRVMKAPHKRYFLQALVYSVVLAALWGFISGGV